MCTRLVRSLSLLLVPVGLGLLSLPLSAVPPPPPGDAARRAEVEAALHGYAGAVESGKADAISARFTPDGQLLLPGLPPLKGREAIRAFLAPMTAAGVVQSAVMSTELLEVRGDTAADQWGTYVEVAGERGKPMETYGGRFAALWRRERDGHWRLARLMMQPVPAAKKADAEKK